MDKTNERARVRRERGGGGREKEKASDGIWTACRWCCTRSGRCARSVVFRRLRVGAATTRRSLVPPGAALDRSY